MEPSMTECRDALADLVIVACDFRRDGTWDEERWAAANAVVDAYMREHREGVQV